MRYFSESESCERKGRKGVEKIKFKHKRIARMFSEVAFSVNFLWGRWGEIRIIFLLAFVIIDPCHHLGSIRILSIKTAGESCSF